MAQPERPVASCQAVVLTYDKASSKWIPAGPGNGISRVQLYKHTENLTYRIVGRNMSSKEVNVNSMFSKSTNYHLATPTFHQWRDPRHVYGLNFSKEEDAAAFSDATAAAIAELKALAADPAAAKVAMSGTGAPRRATLSEPTGAEPERRNTEVEARAHAAPALDAERPEPSASPTPMPATRRPTGESSAPTTAPPAPPSEPTTAAPAPPGPPPTTEASGPPPAPPPMPAASEADKGGNTLADQIKAAKLSASKARAETAPKPQQSAQPSFHEEMARKLKLRQASSSATESSTDEAPAPSPSVVKKVAPPPVVKKKAPGPKKETPEPEVAPAEPAPEPPQTSGAPAAAPPAVDWAAVKETVLNDARAQLAEFTERLLEGLAKSIDAQLEKQQNTQ